MSKFFPLKNVVLALGLVSVFSLHHAYADTEANESAMQAAWETADKAATKGPANIDIASQAKLNVPEGYEFIPQLEANSLMQAMGNSPSTELKGILVSTNPDDNTMYTIDYVNDGYIKDDEAKDLNADEILTSYQEGTEQSNAERKAKGFAELEVTGWGEKPAYDAAKHRLTWALIAHDKGAASTEEDGINYETRILGRDGYVGMTLLGDADQLYRDKVTADQLSAGLSFNNGKRYEDHQDGDRMAEYGLAALITGVAAKKLGLLAMLGVFFAKFAKIIGVAVFAVFPFLKKFFNRSKA